MEYLVLVEPGAQYRAGFGERSEATLYNQSGQGCTTLGGVSHPEPAWRVQQLDVHRKDDPCSHM